MHNHSLSAAASAIQRSIVEHFATECSVVARPVGGRDLAVIRIPLAMFDDREVLLYVERKHGAVTIHDGGRVAHFLRNNGIEAYSHGQNHRQYSHFFDELANRHGFTFCAKRQRAELILAEYSGKQVLAFAECLVSLTFLVMARRTGLYFVKSEAERLTSVKHAIEIAFPGVDIRPEIRPTSERSVVLPGFILEAGRGGRRACLPYLSGSWPEIFQRAPTIVTCAKMGWLEIELENIFWLYGGPPDLLPDTERFLKKLEVESPKVIPFDATKDILNRVADTLQTPKNRGHLAHSSRVTLPPHRKLSAQIKRDEQVDGSAVTEEALIRRALHSNTLDEACLLSGLNRFGINFARKLLKVASQADPRRPIGREDEVLETIFKFYSSSPAELAEIGSEASELGLPLSASDDAVERYALDAFAGAVANLNTKLESLDDLIIGSTKQLREFATPQ
jgi:hypothetical protein